MQRASEPEKVYTALVADLAYSVVPTSIMGMTLVSVGAYIQFVSGSVAILAATILGLLGSLTKIALITVHKRRNARVEASLDRTRRYENMHAAATFTVASSIGVMTALTFSQLDLTLQLVATGLLFGYCAGVVCRLAVRPRIAITAISLATFPSIAAAAAIGDVPHLVVAAYFFAFFLGGVEAILHVHRNARRHITTRLEMETLARRDPLTRLWNRLGLREEFERRPRRIDLTIAVHLFDLDRFKAINDRHGHAAGDVLLRTLAERVRALFPEFSIAARIGGDEFVVVQIEHDGLGVAERTARRIHSILTEPYDIGGGQMASVGLSLGFAIAPARTADLDTLMREADAASYGVKRSGGGYRAAQADTAPAPVPDAAPAPVPVSPAAAFFPTLVPQ